MLSLSTWIVAGGIVVATLVLLGFIAQMYRKVGPNEAFIVYEFGGTGSSRAAARSSSR